MTLVSLDIFAPTDTNARVQNEKDSEVDFLVFRRQNKSLSKELLCSICAALKILHTFSLSVFHAPAHFYCFRSICRQNIFLLWDALCVYKIRACCDSFPLSRRKTRFSSRTRALFSTYSLHQRLVHRLFLPLPERQTAATIGWCDIEYSQHSGWRVDEQREFRWFEPEGRAPQESSSSTPLVHFIYVHPVIDLLSRRRRALNLPRVMPNLLFQEPFFITSWRS